MPTPRKNPNRGADRTPLSVGSPQPLLLSPSPARAVPLRRSLMDELARVSDSGPLSASDLVREEIAIPASRLEAMFPELRDMPGESYNGSLLKSGSSDGSFDSSRSVAYNPFIRRGRPFLSHELGLCGVASESLADQFFNPRPIGFREFEGSPTALRGEFGAEVEVAEEVVRKYSKGTRASLAGRATPPIEAEAVSKVVGTERARDRERDADRTVAALRPAGDYRTPGREDEEGVFRSPRVVDLEAVRRSLFGRLRDFDKEGSPSR